MKLNGRIFKRLWIMLIMISFLPGCWDFQEVDKLAFVTSIGVDQNPGQKINLSIHIPIIQAGLPPVLTGGKESKKFFVLNQTGNSVTEALDYLETKTTRNLVLNQAKSVIIGGNIARKDITLALDHFIRSVQMPLPAFIFITDGATAEEVLSLDPIQNVLPGMLFGYAGQSVNKYNMTWFIPHWKFQQKLVHQSKDPYAPLISIDRVHRVYVISGLAVFNKNRMTGKLSDKETEIFGLLTGVRGSGLMVFNLADEILSLKTISGKSKVKVDIVNGRPFFKIKTTVYGTFTEIIPNKLKISPQEIASYEKAIARDIKNRMTKLVKKLQKCNSDIIDFGEEFRVQHQDIWKKTNWKGTFPTVPFSVKVKVHIEGDGRFR